MVFGWFTRILVALVLVAVVGYDTVSIAASHLSAQDDANNAAGAAATYIHENAGPDAMTGALAAARADLSHGETIDPKTVVLHPDGSVTLTVHRVVGRTLVAQHLSFLKKDLSFNETETASPATS